MHPDDQLAGCIQTDLEHAPERVTDVEVFEAARVLLTVWGEIGAWHHAAEYGTTICINRNTAELARWRRVQEALRVLTGRDLSSEMAEDAEGRADPRRATPAERRVLAFLVEHGRWDVSRLSGPNAEVMSRLIARGWLRWEADVVAITEQGIAVHAGIRMNDRP